MNAASQNLELPLLRMLYGAGLVDRSTIATYSEKNAKGRSILDVLGQNVSLETFRDLMTAEISLKRKGNVEQELFQGLSASGMTTDAELRQALATCQPDPQRLVDALLADSVIGEARAQEMLDGMDGDSPEAYESLIGPGGIGAEAVCQWLAHPGSRQLARAALMMTAQFFLHNGLIDEATARQIAVQAQAVQVDQAAGRLRQQVDLSPSGLKAFMERNLAVPTVDLSQVQVDAALLELFPRSFMRRQTFMPFRVDGTSLDLAMADPFNVTLVALLEWETGRWLRPVFAPAMQVFAKIKGQAEPTAPASVRVAVASPAPAPARPAASPTPAPARPVAPPRAPEPVPVARARAEVARVGDNVSTVQLVSTIIENAIELRATDIHVEPGRQGMTVRFRIDGELRRIMTVPAAMTQSVVSRVKVLADMDVTERRRPQDGHFELTLGARNYDFRISTLPVTQGEKLVIRILDSSRVKNSPESLGFLTEQRVAFEWMLARPYGMLLVSGPTGSGKSSTLYSGLNQLNIEARNLVTIEDPVEYQLDGINQVQVDTNIDVDFAQGLRSILRQDPDVIMIGEIRDGETAQIAIRAAMTGHLVLSTLHTNDAIGAIDALNNLGAARFMVAASLIGIISQRLLRTLCEACKKPLTLTDALRQELELDEKASRKKIRRPVGCDNCLGSGYLGRTGAFEVIRIVERFKTMIVEHRLEELEQTARAEGMIDLRRAAVQKILEGVTSVDEVRRKIMLEI
jgi:type IV pilus assembly protein PilB